MWNVLGVLKQNETIAETGLPFWLLSLVFLILTACGGPPQQSTEGSETPAQLVLSSASNTNFTGLTPSVATTAILQIQNLSDAVPASNVTLLSNLNSPFAFTGGAFPGTAGTCTTTLAAASTCDLDLTINAPTPGSFSTTMVLQYNDGLTDRILSIDLQADAAGVAPIAPLGTWQSGLTHTITAGGSNRVLVFMHAMDIDGATSNVTNVTYGGQAMQSVDELLVGTSGFRTRVEVWICNETCLASAAHSNFNVTYDNGATRYLVYYSLLLSGVNQATPVFDSVTAGNANSNNITINNLAETEGGITLVNAAHGNLNAMTVTAEGGVPPDTSVQQDDAGSLQVRQLVSSFANRSDSPATDFSITATGSQRIVGIAVHFNPN